MGLTMNMRMGLAALAVIGAWGLVVPPATAESVKAMVIVYEDREPGAEHFISRFIITPNHLRLDYGRDSDDFVLIDRRMKSLANVLHEGQRAMLLDLKEDQSTDPPEPLDLVIKAGELDDMPAIAGKRPGHQLILVNDKLCRQQVAVPGLLPDAVEALALFRRILAAQQRRTLAAIPADMRDPCDLAINVFEPDSLLRNGLPIRSWDDAGRGRQLVDLRPEEPVDEALFVIPESYSSFRLSPM